MTEVCQHCHAAIRWSPIHEEWVHTYTGLRTCLSANADAEPNDH